MQIDLAEVDLISGVTEWWVDGPNFLQTLFDIVRVVLSYAGWINAIFMVEKKLNFT